MPPTAASTRTRSPAITGTVRTRREPPMPKIQVHVGLGGSGGRILGELLELAAAVGSNEPPPQPFHVLLVDSDLGDLRKNEARVRAALARTPGAPGRIEAVALADSGVRFDDLVRRRLVHGTAGSPAARQEAERHWPFRDGRPYSGPANLPDAALGSGQCPLVGHFLAWNRLKPIRDAFERLERSVREDLGPPADPLRVDLILAGSLAGGTGRGCWSLIGLAARPIFPHCKPSAYFLDASPFVRTGIDADTTRRLRVNALTGFSEVTGWLRNDVRAGARTPRRFWLPPIDAFGTGQTCLDTERIPLPPGEYRAGRSPVDNVLMAPPETADPSPATAERRAAIALFGRRLMPSINDSLGGPRMRIGGFGAAIARVPIGEIRDCVTAGARLVALGEIRGIDRTAATSKAARFLRSIALSPDELIGEFRRRWIAELDLSTIRDLLGRSATVDRIMEAVVDGRILAPRADRVETVFAATLAERLSQPHGPVERMLTGSIRSIVEGLLEPADRERPRPTFEPVFETDGRLAGLFLPEERTGPEFGTVRLFLDELSHGIDRLRSVGRELQDANGRPPGDPVAATRAEFERRSGRGLVGLGGRRSVREREELEAFLREAALEAVAGPLAARFVAAIERLDTVVERFARPLRALLLEAEELERRWTQDFESIHERVFLPADIDDATRRLDGLRAGPNSWIVDVPPVDPRDGLLTFIREEVLPSAECEPFRAAGHRLLGAVRRSILDPEAVDMPPLRTHLHEMLNSIAIPPEAMSDRFSLPTVLKSIEERVRESLEGHAGEPGPYAALQLAFDRAFGIHHARDPADGEFRLVPLPSWLLAAELAARLGRACDSMVQFDPVVEDPHQDRRVSVRIPHEGVGEGLDGFRRMASTANDAAGRASGEIGGVRWIRHRPGTPVPGYHVETGPARSFSIVATGHAFVPDFTERSLGAIRSARAWHGDAELLAWLRECESPHEARDDERAHRYVHPDFLGPPWAGGTEQGTDAPGLRWAPWREG